MSNTETSIYLAYEARIVYTDSLAGEVVEYVAHDDQATFYAMFTGTVCGITSAGGSVVRAEIIRSPFMVPSPFIGGE